MSDQIVGAVYPSETVGQTALREALSGDLVNAWSAFLANYPHRDGISILYSSSDPDLCKRLIDSAGEQSMMWLHSMQDAVFLGKYRTSITSKIEAILFNTWNNIRNRILGRLIPMAREIPPTGYILFITEHLEWCLVIKYDLEGVAANLKVVHAIRKPRAVYDILDLVQEASDETRTIMKNIIRSPAKIVAHRGVMIHVDRYIEPMVFGPSIDTLYLHEALCNLICENPPETLYLSFGTEILRALEPGCGNGFLSVALITHLRGLQRLVVVDCEMSAIHCTRRNLKYLEYGSDSVIYAVNGNFDPGLFAEKFDLIVVNPPYLPFPEGGMKSRNAQSRAIGGTDLLKLIINKSTDMLSADGVLLMVYSELAQKEVDESIRNCSVTMVDISPNGGFNASFDLEPVVEDVEWVKYLEEKRGLQRDEKKGYLHRLRVAAIIKKEESEKTPSALSLVSLLNRLKTVMKSTSGVLK